MRYSAPLVLALATLSPLSFVSAQWFVAPALNSPIPEQALVAAVRGSGPVTAPLGFQAEAPSRRDPAVAGILSFLIPLGTGSFYAGNVPHGLIHLTVGVGAALLFLSSFCVDECSNDGETKAAVGFAVFVVNWVAGTVVAVGDAKSFNRRQGSAGAKLTAPAFNASPTSGRLVFSLAHLSF
ncbi:MAG: hypothetical protein DMD54_16850 [Gemmatimonadetes bacterium]|nr:MAG: hypothetical protein DMD54_16850 [Gemmatimonadota bacterium]